MKWPWQKNKPLEKLPDFWINYINAFQNLEQSPYEQTRFIAFDTETTGLNSYKDRVLSIGAIGFIDNQIAVSDSLEIYINQEQFKKESVPIHGILKKGKYHKITELEALKFFLDYIGTDVLVAHHASFDEQVINAALARQGLGKLKNDIVDTERLYKQKLHKANISLQSKRYSLDELAEALKIPLHDRHTAAGDAFITAMAFIKIVNKSLIHGKMSVAKLYRL